MITPSLKHSMIQPVILSGGSGSRLWPKSRANYPKQFLNLCGDNSLLQNTAKRLPASNTIAEPIIITNHRHRFLVAEQLLGVSINPAALILEPQGKNTTAAIAIAALYAEKNNPGSILVILPSDHIITDTDKFEHAIAQATTVSSQAQAIVTFGIKPSEPNTGYGYINSGTAIDASSTAFKIAQFTEKPNAELASQYLEQGNYLWNSGIFIAHHDVFIEQLTQFQPTTMQYCRKALDLSTADHDFIRLDEASFSQIPDQPFDVAVMEKSTQSAVIPVDFGWSDVGSWQAIWKISAKDDNGNVIKGSAVTNNTYNCYIDSTHGVIATNDVENLTIVNTEDALLISSSNTTENVKTLVNEMNTKALQQTQNHVKHYRPWGYYQTIELGHHFQVKRLSVKPGKRLSLQYHYHRAEHWVVVSGTAKVTKGEQNILLGPNESTYIPIGEKHRLENPGTVSLEIIEVQSGQYLGEDDIIRIEDDYHREFDLTITDSIVKTN